MRGSSPSRTRPSSYVARVPPSFDPPPQGGARARVASLSTLSRCPFLPPPPTARPRAESIRYATPQACLRDRYLLDILYTSLGPSSLVAINPHKFVNINSDQVLGSYGHDYRNTEETRDHLPPHIFGIAGKAYFDMRRTGRDQSILMR